MNKRFPLLLLTSLVLCGCAKTKLLYDENAYNYPEFDKNYYLEWEDIKDLSLSYSVDRMEYINLHNSDYTKAGEKIKIGTEEISDYTWGGLKETQFGYNNNLSKIEKKFNYGITSKLFDGRVRCEKLYQKSRVQLDKTGFAMYFPKRLVSAKYLGFACRGGTNLDQNEGKYVHDYLNFNFVWSFYNHLDDGTYSKITYRIDDMSIPVDNDGNTSFVNFTSIGGDFKEIAGAVAMSLEWSCNDPKLTAFNLTDNYKEENKNHLALMLYEVFIGDSVWYL